MSKIKRSLGVILSILLILSSVPVFAFAATSEDGYLTYEIENGGAKITDCNTSISGDYTIPSTLGGYSVTSIGDLAFEDCTSLTSVTIPDSVSSIGEWAFYYCSSLTGVTIPAGITSIGSGAFEGCTSLTSVMLPDGVTSIGSSAFYNTGYYNDESNWEDGVLYIGDYLVNAQSDITGSYEIKEGTAVIAGSAFYYCTSLESVTIPDSVTSIGSGAFEDCTSLTSVTVPGSVTSIGSYALGYIYVYYSSSDSWEYVLVDGFTISGYDGTAAETYAEENGITFISLGEYSGSESVSSSIPADAYEFNGHYYYIYSDVCSTWEEAEACCEALGGHLATITSEEEDQALYEYVKNSGYTDVFFGFTDKDSEGNWVWVTGEDVTYTNWGGREPNDSHGGEDYGMYYFSSYPSGQWNDANFGDAGFNFICEWDDSATSSDSRPSNVPAEASEFNGNYYLVYDSYVTWEEAEANCEALGGHLVTITSEEENTFVAALISPYSSTSKNSFFIGFTDKDSEGNWVWVTGEDVTYTNWDRGEPNNGNGGGEQDYATMVKGKSVWDDEWGNTVLSYYICEWEGSAATDEPEEPALVFNTIPAEASEFNGNYYLVYDSYITWEEAKANCEALGGHLVTITSEEENTFVTSLISSYSSSLDFWIGITDKDNEGNWSTWITGETVTYTNWGSGEPDSSEQDYGIIANGSRTGSGYSISKGQWDNIRNNQKTTYYICEWEGSLNTLSIDEENKQITIPTETSAEDFAAMIESGNAKVVDADGEELAADALIGTGSVVQALDDDGNIISEYEVIVPADLNGDGKVTAVDARMALRIAAQLDTGTEEQLSAADIDGSGKITAADARKILRKAANLE
ncbi:MAG: leucine-rich repeat protein [Clostridiales bacterium]|nr:leucine-rich repeat protein [Clostridiales bacterium]